MEQEFRCCSCLNLKKISCKVIGPTGKAVCTICDKKMKERLQGRTTGQGGLFTPAHIAKANRNQSMRKTERMIERVVSTCGDL